MKKLLATLLILSLTLSLVACITPPPPAEPAPPTTEPTPTQTEEVDLAASPVFEHVIYEDIGIYIPTEPTEDGQFLEALLKDCRSDMLSRSYMISELKEEEYTSYTFSITYREGMRATMCRPSIIAAPELYLLLHIPEGADAEEIGREVYENTTAYINPSTIAEVVCVYTFEDKVLLTLCHKDLFYRIDDKLRDMFPSGLTWEKFHSGFYFQHTNSDFEEIAPTRMGTLLEDLHGRCHRLELVPYFDITELDPYQFREMTGTTPVEGMEAYFCNSQFFPPVIPHTAVLMEVPEGTDVAALCDSMQSNANLEWWRYSRAETVAVASHENMILFVMSTEEIAHTMMETFDDIMKK